MWSRRMRTNSNTSNKEPKICQRCVCLLHKCQRSFLVTETKNISAVNLDVWDFSSVFVKCFECRGISEKNIERLLQKHMNQWTHFKCRHIPFNSVFFSQSEGSERVCAHYCMCWNTITTYVRPFSQRRHAVSSGLTPNSNQFLSIEPSFYWNIKCSFPNISTWAVITDTCLIALNSLYTALWSLSKTIS